MSELFDERPAPRERGSGHMYHDKCDTNDEKHRAEAASPAALDVTAFARIWYEESSGGRWSALSDTVRSLWLRRAERVAARLTAEQEDA